MNYENFKYLTYNLLANLSLNLSASMSTDLTRPRHKKKIEKKEDGYLCPGLLLSLLALLLESSSSSLEVAAERTLEEPALTSLPSLSSPSEVRLVPSSA